MGKAARWFKGLLGMKKEKAQQPENSKIKAFEKNETRRWSFTKSGTDSSVRGRPQIPATAASSSNVYAADADWMRSFIAASEKDQNKHAIAVAAATAAAADAAVAAAQAAVAVVRLTSKGGGALFLGGREKWAAVKIQTVFRSYLVLLYNLNETVQRFSRVNEMARKALRALRGLVKIQALVRGFLVRKRAAATLHSMQALIRAQAAARSERARRSFNHDNRLLPQIRSRKSTEETRSEFHSKRMSALHESPIDESPKIVEIDTCKPRSRSRRFTSVYSECAEDVPCPFPYPVPPRISVPDCRHIQDFEYCFIGDDCKFSTAQSTPRLATSMRSNAPVTPSKSVCGETFFRPYINFPNYMANTQSFNAKLRSYSAPKQRPETGSKKRLSLNEIMAARNSLSSVKMQRPYFQIPE